MAKRLQLRRKLTFDPPKPKLYEGLREGTYEFYRRRSIKVELYTRTSGYEMDSGYCLDRAMPDLTDGFRPKTGDKIKFLGLDIHVHPGMGDRVHILPPHNPNRPMFWLDNEGPFFFSGSGRRDL